MNETYDFNNLLWSLAQMKLKRRTNRELWHIVGDEEETVSVLPAPKQVDLRQNFFSSVFNPFHLNNEGMLNYFNLDGFPACLRSSRGILVR